MRLVIAAALLLAAGPAGAAKVQAPVLTVNVAPNGNPYLPVKVKDATLNVRIGLSFDSILLLNPDAAARARLKPFPLIGKGSIKNAVIPGGRAVFRFNVASTEPKGLPRRRVPTVWLDIPVAADGDGVMAIGQLDSDRMEIVLRDTAPGSTTISIPKKGSGEAQFRSRIGGEDVTVSLELNNPTTVMNARAGEALLTAGLASRVARIGYWRPFPQVALPMQSLAPKAGLTIAGLPMRQMAVRVSEDEARRIDASARGTSTAEDDEDTITVTADRKKKRGRDPWILIGRDVLDDCSRIVFDRAGKRWLLTCNFG
jgi:hypothetical protein